MATPIGHPQTLPLGREHSRDKTPRKVPPGISLLLGLAFSILLWGAAILGAVRVVQWLADLLHA